MWGIVETVNSQQPKSIWKVSVQGFLGYWSHFRKFRLLAEQTASLGGGGVEGGSPQGSWVPVATKKHSNPDFPESRLPGVPPTLVQKLCLDYSLNWDDLVFSCEKCTPIHVNIRNVGLIAASFVPLQGRTHPRKALIFFLRDIPSLP